VKLIELEPHWIGLGSSPNVVLTGVSFLCPHCKAIRLAAMFKNPIDPQNWLPRITTIPHGQNEWERTGETFETLTLRPSINTEWANHWHGFILNGEIV